MGDQRRRGGRGRSGRGGRIPRKGEAQASAQAHDEQFVSFPLEVAGPIRVTSLLDEAAVESVLLTTLERERRQAAAVAALAESGADPVLADVQVQLERHRDVLEQLGRDLGAELPGDDGSGGAAGEGDDPWDIVAVQRLSRLGWQMLQQVAYATGDRRIDRVVKPVLREKERHSEVLETFALRSAARSLFRQPED